jgi:hypothetical protein
MGKKIDKLRCVVREMGDRYGVDDADVMRLQQDLGALERSIVDKPVERRKVQVCRYSFGSVARQHFRGN